MKLWHFAVLLGVLGIAYVLINRPTVPKTATASASNASFATLGTALANLGSAVFSSSSAPKATAPSAVPPVTAAPGFAGEQNLNSSGTDDPALASNAVSQAPTGGDWDVLS